MTPQSVPFLMYHNILPEGDPYTISKEMFKQQMALLHDLNYTAVSVRDFIARIQPENSRNTRHVCLTFDDGYTNNYIYCAPELGKYNFKATFYITTSLIDSEQGFSEQQILSLSEMGMEIGSHTVNHRFLSNLPEVALRFELEKSKRQLEEIVHKPIRSLSLPGGRGNKRIWEAARRAGYQSICTSEYRPNDKGTNLFSLGRIPVRRDYSLELFQKIVALDKSVWESMKFKQDIKFIIQRILGNKLYHTLWKMRYE